MILAQRNIFHQAVAGEALDQTSDVFATAVGQLSSSLVGHSGISPNDAHQVSGLLVVQTLTRNAYIQSICDVFYIVAVLSLVSVLPIVLLRTQRKSDERGR